MQLARAVDGADGAPTADATIGTQHFLGTSESTLGAWQAFKEQVVTKLDARLVAAGRPPVAPAR